MPSGLTTWILYPRQPPLPLPPIRLSHTRAVPLPLSIGIKLDDSSPYEGNYAGHGKTKLGYRLSTSTQVSGHAPQTLLKMRPECDPEPILFFKLFCKLPNELCPTVYDIRECRVYRNPDPNSG